MQNIPDKVIVFSNGQIGALEFALGFIMFSVSLAVSWEDFRKIWISPKKIFVGLSSQWILLPLLTLLTAFVISPNWYLGLGMLLIAACPGGNISNFFSYLSKGNVELSISLTLLVTLLSPFTMPLIFNGLQSLYLEGEAKEASVVAEFMPVFLTVLKIMVLPLALGVGFNYKIPLLTQKLIKPAKYLSMLILLGFIVGSFIPYKELFLQVIGDIFGLVFLMNLIALVAGLAYARFFLPFRDAKTVSIETGIQNSGLGLVLIIKFFDGNGEMAVIAAWWGIWHIITGFIISFVYSRMGKLSV